MVLSPRVQYIIHAAAGTLACLGSFLLARGAAFGGGPLTRQWVALALLAGSLLVLGLMSAIRAAQVGLPRWLGFLGIIFGAIMGPAVLVLMLVLAFKKEDPPYSREDAEPTPWNVIWFQPLVVLVWPFVVWWWFTHTQWYR